MKRLLLIVGVALLMLGCATNDYYRFMGGVDTNDVEIGMTKSEFMEIAPRPDRINRTVTSRGTQEQWVYDIGYDTQYFYFNESGRLTSYQSGSM